ncbi:hypothetical protein, partial [Escherichia coli]|uniref:hypothetical protein n=1 Tax=Escherichia coli TaxID=562 RepID=UPI001931BDF9
FLERLLFPYLAYTDPPQSLFPKKIRSAWIYTMNASEKDARQMGYDQLFEQNEFAMKMIFGNCTSLMSYDTYQFEDYSKMEASRFDVDHKEKRRR